MMSEPIFLTLTDQVIDLEYLDNRIRMHSDQSFYRLGVIDSDNPILSGTDIQADDGSPDPYFPGSPPVSEPYRPTTYSYPDYSGPDGGKFLRPTSGRVSSPFGWRIHPIKKTRKMHWGVDLAPGKGKPIYAAASGKVIFSGVKGGYGNTVDIEHEGNAETRYAHCATILVRVGETVRRGQQIATVGSTGLSTGPHLHFELKLEGKRVDPLPYLG